MVKKIVSISATCLVLLVGCGGGSSDEPSGDTSTGSENTDSGEGTNSDNNTLLTGVFVDSAVEGVSYSTATQSDVTNSAGEFSYLAGEQVTFSIGATELPTVDAAPQVSPVEMGEGSSNPDATTTNIARLLQSLDADGNPDNGITISAEAAANVAVIDFDVSVEEFETNTDVINLVANSGSSNTALISADVANAHLNETLNLASESENVDSNNVTLATLAGFYDSTVNGNRQFYLLINSNGTAINYDENRDERCFETENWNFVSLGGDLFRLERPTRDSEEFRIARQNGDLILNSDSESERVVLPLVTAIDPSDVTVCS